MTRALPEWIGKSSDSAIPPRVRLRVLERGNHKCQECTREIQPWEDWQTDHVIALINGGENRESNLRSLCENCHGHKTRADVAEKSKTYTRRKSHYGLRKAKRPMDGSRDSPFKKKMDGRVERRRSY